LRSEVVGSPTTSFFSFSILAQGCGHVVGSSQTKRGNEKSLRALRMHLELLRAEMPLSTEDIDHQKIYTETECL
jgi:hypothetical protein